MRRQLAGLPLLVVLLGAVAPLCWVPAAHAAIMRDHHTAQAFFYSGLVLGVLAVMLGLAMRGGQARSLAQSRLAALVWAYLLLPLAMALPLGLAVRDTSWGNAWFEMVSTFTTTGASVYEPGRLAPSVHLWRALTGWAGGLFTLVAAFAILAPLNLGGAEVISGRMPGQAARQAEPPERFWQTAGVILPVYAALTFALWLALLIAGEDGLLALTHAMGTLSTSGVSSGVGLSVTASGLPGEVLLFLFLLLPLSRRLMPLPGIVPRQDRLRDDPELRLGLALIGLVVAVLLLRHVFAGAKAGAPETLPQLIRAFWGAAFTAVSFLSTTGYESAWWTSARDWAGLGAPGMMLLGLAILGGGVATTAGGVKLLRVHALYLHGRHELEKIVHPSAVVGGGALRRRLAGPGARAAWVFFMLFAISVTLLLAALTLAGESFERALVLGIAALTTTGPLAHVAGGAPIDYAPLGGPVKAILGLAMVLGRLETLALIALFTPQGWRR